MTQAIIGAFLLHHFDAHWGWWFAVGVCAWAEIYAQETWRKAAFRLLGNIQAYLHNREFPLDRDDD